MLHVDFVELRNRNINFILSPDQGRSLLLLLVLDALCLLVVVYILLDGVRDLLECLTL
jgi:hypothetical protein